jgi:lysyl-tRNA synthetase class 1
MFWADTIADQIRDTRTPKDGKRFVIRDEKTLSGRVHVGSLRGLAIHGIVSDLLTQYGIDNTFLWEHNDFDDFDTVPGYLPHETFTQYLAAPLYTVPSPEPGFENYAEYYGAEFVQAHAKLGYTPHYYRAYKDLYAPGKMDACIMTALAHTDEIRRILKSVSGSDKDASWLPISVVCEACGRIKTTRAYDFDGDTVSYTCDVPAYGASPCGKVGRVVPTKGAAKLFWKVDWAAKWVALGVDIEGGGKDHSTKGGSRDVANHIAREIFDFEPPYDIPYEFFLVGGKKMSSSKGRGSSAKEMTDLFPSEVFRLLLLGKEYSQQIDVDPSGDSVPRLYDWYDELAEKVREGISDDFTRLYALCELPKNRAGLSAPWQMRFSQVAFMVQMPHLSLEKEAEAVKGSPLTDEEKQKLNERATYARFWLKTYASEEYKYELQESAPKTYSFTDTQKKALQSLYEYMKEKERSGEEIHATLHALKSETPIAPKELFEAIYQLFLARSSGPKAGWFLSVLPRDMVLKRLTEAVSS